MSKFFIPFEPLRVIDLSFDLNDFIPFNLQKFLTIGDGDPVANDAKGAKSSAKWGQLKLLISEINFLNLYWNPELVKKPQLVYVGAAPGDHIVVLAQLFPWITFHLYDNRAFCPDLEKCENVRINLRYFDQTDLNSWSGRNDLFFMSDIRNLVYNPDQRVDLKQREKLERESQAIIDADMTLQMNWVTQIKPVKSLLKFRLPHSYDWLVKEKPTYSYLDGSVFIQPWGRPNSTECRLVPLDDLSIREWDYIKHEGQMVYHNLINRSRETGYKYQLKPLDDVGLTQDYDSTYTIYVIQTYLTKINKPSNQENVNKLIKYCLDNTDKATNLINIRNGVRRNGGKLIDPDDQDD